MDWLYGEPTLEDMLSDPTIHAVMDRDGVDDESLRTLLHVISHSASETVSLTVAA